MIMPQTGPRPVYKAPVPAPGAPPRPAPGRPVPGQPIFQRTARPQAPGAASAAASGRTASDASDTRGARRSASARRGSGSGAMAPPGPSRPGSRPGAPSRRPGQRYVPRGVKEGPMKGYTPPPRMTISNEPLPITRNITITEGISVKDLAEKLGIRAKDLIARLVVRGVFATINQTLDAELASEMARFFGAETEVITFEEQAAKDTDRGDREQRGRRGSGFASAGGHHHGPRRPRQNHAARLDSLDRCGGRRSGRHYAAYRRLQGSHRGHGVSGLRPRDRVPRYARPRSVHAHAFARRESDRHRRAGHRRRRRRDAADGGSDRPRACCRSSDHRRGEQDR